jgi:hypothetical protein
MVDVLKTSTRLRGQVAMRGNRKSGTGVPHSKTIVVVVVMWVKA